MLDYRSKKKTFILLSVGEKHTKMMQCNGTLYGGTVCLFKIEQSTERAISSSCSIENIIFYQQLLTGRKANIAEHQLLHTHAASFYITKILSLMFSVN